jgi:hypothetical protein
MKELIESYEKEVIEIYKRENLVALRDNEYKYEGVELHEIFSIPNNSTLSIPNFNKIKNFWDIINCNSDLRHFTALLYFYRPFINDPNNDKINTDNFPVYSYFQNLPDRRFSQFASVCFEKLYNYCDRIGDLLAHYYPSKFPDVKRIYFPNVIDKLKDDSDLNNEKYFNDLLTYREVVYQEINKRRKEIVHYYQFETNYRFDFNLNASNEEEIKKLWEFKNGLPEYFGKHLKLSNELYINTLNLIKTKYLP